MPKEKGGRIEEIALALVKPVVEGAGFTLWDVIFEKEGAMWYLRVLFDKDGGGEMSSITDEECANITAPLNQLLDGSDIIQSVDILEIGSPGLTRKLRWPQHFRQCMGMPVRAFLRDERGKTVATAGTLDAYDEDSGTVTVGGEDILLKKCMKINLEYTEKLNLTEEDRK